MSITSWRRTPQPPISAAEVEERGISPWLTARRHRVSCAGCAEVVLTAADRSSGKCCKARFNAAGSSVRD